MERATRISTRHASQNLGAKHRQARRGEDTRAARTHARRVLCCVRAVLCCVRAVLCWVGACGESESPKLVI